jgi:LPS sulfotransferase NodH
MDQRLTILLSHERSGSHFLSDFIRSLRGTRTIDEVGNPQALRPATSLDSIHRFRKEAIDADPALLLEPSDERHDRFLSSYFSFLRDSRKPDNVVVDIKYAHVHLFETFWWPLLARPFLFRHCEQHGIRILHLHRQNVIEAAASALIANQRRAWHTWEAKAAETADQTFRLDAKAVVRNARLLARQSDCFERRWMGSVERMTVTYEQVAASLGQGGALDREIAAFVGGSSVRPFSPRSRKMTKPLHEVVENYHELRRECDAAGLSRFLVAAGGEA